MNFPKKYKIESACSNQRYRQPLKGAYYNAETQELCASDGRIAVRIPVQPASDNEESCQISANAIREHRRGTPKAKGTHLIFTIRKGINEVEFDVNGEPMRCRLMDDTKFPVKAFAPDSDIWPDYGEWEYAETTVDSRLLVKTLEALGNPKSVRLRILTKDKTDKKRVASHQALGLIPRGDEEGAEGILMTQRWD